jgi:transporter family protein
MSIFSSWQAFALGSAFFAGWPAVLGKLGVEGLSFNLVTHIRTVTLPLSIR